MKVGRQELALAAASPPSKTRLGDSVGRRQELEANNLDKVFTSHFELDFQYLTFFFPTFDS